MIRRLCEIALAALVAAGGTSLGAQERPRDKVSERVAGERPQADRLARAVQERLELTDDQTRRLRDATTQFASQRQQLLRRERVLRRDLRGELARGQAAQQERVAQLLDELLGLQRRRADVLIAEQRALAEFLTPVQRAEFVALQERAFRAAQLMRAQREGRGAPGRDGRLGGPPR